MNGTKPLYTKSPWQTETCIFKLTTVVKQYNEITAYMGLSALLKTHISLLSFPKAAENKPNIPKPF